MKLKLWNHTSESNKIKIWSFLVEHTIKWQEALVSCVCTSNWKFYIQYTWQTLSPFLWLAYRQKTHSFTPCKLSTGLCKSRKSQVQRYQVSIWKHTTSGAEVFNSYTVGSPNVWENEDVFLKKRKKNPNPNNRGIIKNRM